MADEEKPKDAPEGEGGSAASRAGQFLEGPITQAFCSPEKVGYRCATQTPGCESTGFTGQCTKQPEVGGAWPCMTALPLCRTEPTGFTGECTQYPWPNPTRYVGCTVLHCPTNDLTHQPHICRIVEEGVRGGAAKGGGEEAAAQPVTSLLGCGYTQTWGLCQTHLLGCGYTKEWGPNCPPSVQGPCITRTEMPGCQTRDLVGAAGPGAAPTGTIDCNPSAVDACPTLRGCQTQPPTALCTQKPESCPTFCGPECQTPQPNCTSINCTQAGPQCPQTIPPQCPVGSNPILDCTFGCTQFGPACPATPLPRCAVTGDAGCQTVNVQPQAFGAAAAPGSWPTPQTRCRVCDPVAAAIPNTAATTCTQFGPGCHTYPNGDCTFFGCGPGGGGGGGQTAATVCTQFSHQCQSAVDACPTRLCGGGGAVGAVAAPGSWPTPQTRCFICDPVAARAAAMPNTAATTCTQFGPGCHTYPNGDCTFFGCGPGGGGGGGQTAATVCTQFSHQCQSAVDACPTRLCGGGGAVGAVAAPGSWPTPQTRCFVCDPVAARAAAMPNTAATVCTQYGPGCHTYPNGDCTFFGCGPGGGGGGGQTAATVCTQFSQQCQSAVDACPTRLCGQQAVGSGPSAWLGCTQPPYCEAGGRGAALAIWPTPATRCFIC